MRSFFRVLSVILLVTWMGFIFFMSAQPAETSSQISGGVIEVIAEKIYPDFENLSQPERAEIVSSFQFAVRKTAHAVGFAILGTLAFMSFVSYVRLGFFTRTFLAVAVSLCFAASDEYHQRFVPGRSCELRDFIIDACGILVAVLLCTFFVKVIGPLRRKTAFVGKRTKGTEGFNNPSYIKYEEPALEKTVIDRFMPSKEPTSEELDEPEITDSVTEENEITEQILPNDGDLPEQDEPSQGEVILDEIPETEEEMENNTDIKLSDEMQYAASVIGNVVVEVTRVCNKITATAPDETGKELINLSLGRTEVFKAEVLKVLGLEVSFEEKKNLIEKEKREVYDYFNSIMAQMC